MFKGRPRPICPSPPQNYSSAILRPIYTELVLAYAEVVEYSKDFSDAPKRQSQLRTLLGEVYPYFLTYPILERYTDIRRSLRKPHGKGLIGDIDTLIAATAVERNLTVVTIDTDFQRVPALKVILLSPSSLKVLSAP
jgi:predicted nucleic acid-binding protein